MSNKKLGDKEFYAFVGVVSLIFFIGYDGFFNENIKPEDSGGGWKSQLGRFIMWTIWKLGDDYTWVYILFRGIFLVLALWMGYKIYRRIYIKNKK